MEKSILISVVIPIYNVEQYLHQCVDSIINQTYKNLEIILVDDGSTDNSPKICDEYALKDNRIKVIHKKNGGLSDARNSGISVISGKYITFVDGDDWLLSSAIENWYKILIEKTSDICVSRLLIYKDNKFNKYPIPLFEDDVSKYGLDVFLIRSACGKLYKVKFLKKHNLKFIKGMKFEDSIFWYSLLESSPIISFTNKSQYVYRQRIGSITHSGDYRDLYHEYKCLFKTIRNLNAEKALQEYWNSIILKSTQFFILSNKKYRYRFFLKMKAFFKRYYSKKSFYIKNIIGKVLIYLWQHVNYVFFYILVLPLFILKNQKLNYYLKNKFKG